MNANPTAAQAAFLAQIGNINALLERIQGTVNDHLGYAPHSINWGHAGTAAHYAEQLQQISDAMHSEGECAAEATR